MIYEIFPTTAEHIISSVDCVLLKRRGCDEHFVAEFLDIPNESAKNALQMAEQIGFILFNSDNQCFLPSTPVATYLVTSSEQQKALVLRFMLEQYEPYSTFKNRLRLSGLADTASEQVRVIYGMHAHREIIKNTITSLGTYAQSLTTEGAGLYRAFESIGEIPEYFLRFNNIVSDREKNDAIIRTLLGPEAADWVDKDDTLEPLIVAYMKLPDSTNDPRSPILYAGNAFDSFLSKLGNHFNVNLNGANGINAKIDRIAHADHMYKKQKSIGKYIGHIRNACDHGADSEIGQQWGILPETSYEYVHIVITCIKGIIGSLSRRYYV